MTLVLCTENWRFLLKRSKSQRLDLERRAGCTVVRLCISAEGILVSMIGIGVHGCTVETLWIGTVGIEVSEIGMGNDVENFAT